MASFSSWERSLSGPQISRQSASSGTSSAVSRESSSSSIFCFSTADWKLALRADSPCPVSVYSLGRVSRIT